MPLSKVDRIRLIVIPLEFILHHHLPAVYTPGMLKLRGTCTYTLDKLVEMPLNKVDNIRLVVFGLVPSHVVTQVRVEVTHKAALARLGHLQHLLGLREGDLLGKTRK